MTFFFFPGVTPKPCRAAPLRPSDFPSRSRSPRGKAAPFLGGCNPVLFVLL